MRHVKLVLAGSVFLAGACGPHIRPLEQVMDNGEVVRTESDEVVARARGEGAASLEQMEEARMAAAAAALSTCAPEVCAAISRGELALGMNEAQVLAATRTSAHAWDTRRSGRVTVMTPRHAGEGPSDVISEVAFIALQGDAVTSYTYREPQGLRTVATRQDATPEGRAAAQADALLRQGDEYAVAGRLDLALERYDQADVLRPNHAQTTLRIAQVLDKSLRPLEAILRYQLFIHQMELERIHAKGEAAAKIAEAIARAHERIIVLERR